MDHLLLYLTAWSDSGEANERQKQGIENSSMGKLGSKGKALVRLTTLPFIFRWRNLKELF